jgi:tellurite resistance protein
MKNTWLMRLPVGLFAIPVGLFALAGAWRRASAFDWEMAAPVSRALGAIAAVLLAVLVLLYAAKTVRYRQSVAAEFTHPLIGSLLALIPLSLMLCSVHFGQANHAGWLTFTLLALTLQGVIALRVVSLLATGKLHAVAVTPALYLPPVAGGFVGALALHTLGYPGWAGLLFGMGLASWALLEARVLNSLFEGPLPEALRPTIGVELAPPIVATLVAASLWPALPGEVLIVGLGVSAGPLVAVMARWSWWTKVPFSIGFWSFSFPVAALAGAVIEVLRRGHWPALVGAIALTMASSVFLFLTVRTLVLIIQGRLLPSSPVQRSQLPGSG